MTVGSLSEGVALLRRPAHRYGLAVGQVSSHVDNRASARLSTAAKPMGPRGTRKEPRYRRPDASARRQSEAAGIRRPAGYSRPAAALLGSHDVWGSGDMLTGVGGFHPRSTASSPIRPLISRPSSNSPAQEARPPAPPVSGSAPARVAITGTS